ncbi:MAG TPA: hypothetical protein VIT65_07300 [Microlunatus sp.]
MKLATYALALVVVFVAALELGFRVRPEAGASVGADTSAGTSPGGHGGSGQRETGHADTGRAEDSPSEASDQREPEGLAATADGYRLTLLTPRPAAGPATPIRLLITGPDERPVTTYEVAHGKRLHLIVVRRDLASFQHLHPVLDPTTGVWTTTMDTSAAGTYRVFADVVPQGHDGLTLGADLAVPGSFAPEPPATTESRTARIGGYEVRLAGDAHAGQTGTVTVTVTNHGRPVTDLDPYLEAYGHLVALRQSDLAYLHVHPDGHPGDQTTPAGPTIDFSVEVPTTGVYRLFLDFQHAGVVRTAPFVIVVDR